MTTNAYQQALAIVIERDAKERLERQRQQYALLPAKVDRYTYLIMFDEHEAREAGWRDDLIRDALAEIRRREGA